jgi:DNA polymerase III sliding clamp (beta) subunit (PCNA family)
MNPNDTPRTDAVGTEQERILANALVRAIEMGAKAEAEVDRLRELLEKVLFELEKVPFQTPKLTAFTAHRLADRYRDEMTNNSTKPADNQEYDKQLDQLKPQLEQ